MHRTIGITPLRTLAKAEGRRVASSRKAGMPPRCSRTVSSGSYLRPSGLAQGRKNWVAGVLASVAVAAFSLHTLSRKPLQNSSHHDHQEKVLTETTVERKSRKELEDKIDDVSLAMRDRMSAYIQLLQTEIVEGLSSLDPSTKFRWDHWERSSGGSGTSCILQDGAVFEKAGVNVSIVHGSLPPAAVSQMRHRLDEDRFGWWDGKTELPFFACGISLVTHPHNPMAPTVHLNYRYFEIIDPADKKEDDAQQQTTKPKVWWFGGGTDLTPSYLFPEDAEHFHRTLKTQCDRHDPRFYPDFKSWCDRYFYIPHRHERRGIGGIFFDDLASDNPLQLFHFIRDLGNHFLPSYLPILERRQWMRFSDHHKRWQQLRRGRYVEFNLVYDRGTKFGLATPGARIESILMSLPLTSRWEYMSELGTELESPEKELLEVLKNPREWV
ncbi:hypothetical protein PCANC_10676 [Puccinia coronata f. sp. avenae]|uniref:coproporphyrinogen oxidase n=1 Tax=Puccinia coronata f. sp. avenae TaxID=200324 RepID=A0A2N5VG57_9BASI|nr:hypothetical protein PCANC_10676 [Puccinia coronata f. sp. avenae]